MTSTEPRSNIVQYPRQLRRRRMAVMFVDLDHFMRICTDDPPEAVFRLLHDFQHVVTDAVSRFTGKLNSYQGDGVLATFGDVTGRADCATRTLKCARKILEQIRALSIDYTSVGGRPVSVSIGLQYGHVWFGTIAISRRFGPTLIGDAVNVAVRLEQGAHAVDAEIVAGDDFIQRAQREAGSSELAQFVNAGPLFIHGRRSPVEVWKLQVQSSEFLLGQVSTLDVGTDVDQHWLNCSAQS
jgi:adenylate cyclase